MTHVELLPVRRPQESDGCEFELLCACCRAAKQKVTIEIHSRVNWDRLLKLASSHRVLPAVAVALRNRAEIPGSIHSALSARLAAHGRRVLRFSAELSAIRRKFAECGVEAMLYKGPALAQRLYGDAAMREFGDLDFLVRVEDVSRAGAALRELGFQQRLQLSPRQEREYLRIANEYAFGSGAEPNLIELQWQVAPRFYCLGFRTEELLRRSVEIEFEGTPARVLSDEDLMLALCAHAAKHCWSQLGMLRDIAALAREELDWEWIGAEARRLGIMRIVLVSLVLVRNLLGREFPPQFGRGPDVELAERLAARVQERLNRGEEPDLESAGYFRFMMQLRERWQDRVRFAWRLGLTPGIAEWNAVVIPDMLFSLYQVVRVWRLLRRLISGGQSLFFRRLIRHG